MRQAPRSLILVTVDSLRADHVGFAGYRPPTTPFLDSLAGESIVFANVIAAGSPTYYSLPAILASRYPLTLGRDLLGLAPDETTIASVLKECGFETAAFVAANPYVSARFGYEQGFDTFQDFLGHGFHHHGFDHDEEIEFALEKSAASESALRSRTNQALSRACHRLPYLGAAYDELYFQYCQKFGVSEHESLDSLRRFPSAGVIVDHAIAWLNEISGRPFFLWLHLMDPHAPYFPKPEALQEMGCGELRPGRARYLNSYWARGDLQAKPLQKKRDQVVALYDAGIRWADTQIRRLTEKLVELNAWSRCAFAVTADHGEEFLDHGGRFHAPLKLTEELVHVPLLLRVPGFPKPGGVNQPLSLIDLAPTLMDVLDVPTPSDFRGRSCWAQLEKGETWDRAVFTESVCGCANPFLAGNRVAPRILAVRKGGYKLVIDFNSNCEQLFDLQFDPREQCPLPSESAVAIRRDLLEHARKHLVESHKSRDFDRRIGSQLRDLRLEWAHSTANGPN